MLIYNFIYKHFLCNVLYYKHVISMITFLQTYEVPTYEYKLVF